MGIRSKVDMAKYRREKVLRTMTRLKHSLAADEELNETLMQLRKNHSDKVLKGILPKPIDVSKIVDD